MTKTLAVLAAAAAWLALVLVIFDFGLGATSAGLDASWSAALAYAWTHGLQWGRDIVFTYGPLGFATTGATFDPGTFYPLIAVRSLVSGITAAFALLVIVRGGWLAGVLLVIAYCGSPPIDGYNYLLAAVSFLGACIATRDRSDLSSLSIVFAGLVPLAVVALLKFSFFPIYVAWAALMGATFALRGRWRLAAAAYVLAPAVLLGAWVVAGQNAANLPDFIASSMEIARGYDKAMNHEAPLPTLLILFAMFAMAGIALLARAWQAGRFSDEWPWLAFAALLLLVAWKNGLTRADPYHVQIFPAVLALVAALAVSRPRATSSRPLSRAVVGVWLLLFAGSSVAFWKYGPRDASLPGAAWSAAGTIPQRARLLADLRGLYDQRMQSRGPALKPAELPRTRALVGDATVDLYMFSQISVLASGLNYHPRPVFQSYAAFTPALLELNAASVRNDATAPDYALVSVEPIDGRLTTQEDSLAMFELLRRYEPVMMERQYLVLRRDRPHWQKPGETRTIAARLGDVVELPDFGKPGPVLAKIRLRPLALGKLLAVLLGEPKLMIEATDGNGQSWTSRFIRGNGEAGFLVSPFYNSTSEFALARTQSSRRLAKIRLVAQGMGTRFAFAPAFDIELVHYPLTDVQRPLPQDIVQSAFPGFDRLPDVIRGGVGLMPSGSGDENVVLAHATSTLGFALAPGSYRIEYDYGIVPGAYGAGCPGTDGVGFRLHLDDGGAAATLDYREVRPRDVEADRARLHAAKDFSLANRGTVFITTDPGPAGNVSCDWSYLRDLSIISTTTGEHAVSPAQVSSN